MGYRRGKHPQAFPAVRKDTVMPLRSPRTDSITSETGFRCNSLVAAGAAQRPGNRHAAPLARW